MCPVLIFSMLSLGHILISHLVTADPFMSLPSMILLCFFTMKVFCMALIYYTAMNATLKPWSPSFCKDIKVYVLDVENT